MAERIRFEKSEQKVVPPSGSLVEPSTNLGPAALPAPSTPPRPPRLTDTYKSPNDARFIFFKWSEDMDPAFARGIIKQIERLAPHADARNLLYSAVKDVPSKNPFRIMLALQMCLNHMAIIERQSQLLATTNIADCEILERSLNRLSRTFMQQLEVNEGNQTKDYTVNVQNVSVNEGAQAIVSNIVKTDTQQSNDTTVAGQQQADTTALTQGGRESIESRERQMRRLFPEGPRKDQ